MTSSQTRARSQSANLVEIKTPLRTIKAQNSEKLLGCRIQDDIKWNQYLRDDEESLMKNLSQKLSALQLLSKLANFKTRKMLANGVFMSRLSYMMIVWGSCKKELMDGLQVLQNRAARVVTRNDWNLSTKQNLRQLGWLSVHQLLVYQSVVSIHKIRENSEPIALHNMFNWETKQNTRQVSANTVRPIGVPRYEVANRSFRWRASRWFNSLPKDIKLIRDIKTSKGEAKQWIMTNIEIKM